MSIKTVFAFTTLCLFFLAGCYPLTELTNGPAGPFPTMAPLHDEGPPTTSPTEVYSNSTPSNPETDHSTWNYLNSLVLITSGMDGERDTLTDADVERLENEIYPLFVQAQLNCGQWVEPFNDYEPLVDVLAMITFFGTETYDYDPTALLEFLLHGAAQPVFALTSEEKGCIKSLFLLFVSYEGES